MQANSSINPYLDAFNKIKHKHGFYDFKFRSDLVEDYAWAIPNTEAINAIKDLGKPVIELGAGSGYWASLIDKAGVDIICFDRNDGQYAFTRNWFNVQQGSIEKIARHANRALMLCWPCYDTSFAHDALKVYQKHGGQTLIYIGEGQYGCTANEDFFTLRNKDWKRVRVVDIPQWDGIHDYMEIFVRG